MSVRTFDPREAELFGAARCSEQGCNEPYSTICKRCNLAYCRKHLSTETPHSCVLHGHRLYNGKHGAEKKAPKKKA